MLFYMCGVQENSAGDLSWRISDLWGLFQQATQHIWQSPDSGGEASYS